VEVEDGTLVLRRIHVVFSLQAQEPAAAAAAGRAHEAFKPKCPVYRSLHRAIDITTELQRRDAS
jgi:uncharacterized OsmC-like protein